MKSLLLYNDGDQGIEATQIHVLLPHEMVIDHSFMNHEFICEIIVREDCTGFPICLNL